MAACAINSPSAGRPPRPRDVWRSPPTTPVLAHRGGHGPVPSSAISSKSPSRHPACLFPPIPTAPFSRHRFRRRSCRLTDLRPGRLRVPPARYPTSAPSPFGGIRRSQRPSSARPPCPPTIRNLRSPQQDCSDGPGPLCRNTQTPCYLVLDCQTGREHSEQLRRVATVSNRTGC